MEKVTSPSSGLTNASFMAKRKTHKNSEQQSHVPYKATGLDGLNRFGEPLQGKKYCQEQITTLGSQRPVW